MLSKRRFSIATIVFATLAHGLAFAQTNQFLGAQSCASSSCHGGAEAKSNQNLIWSQHDPHSKSFTTLVAARSERIAESLNITNAAKSSRCTVCHAPFATIPIELAATALDPAEGVSCESCHGMAKSWLRSHTRKDLSHDDKVATGMRDVRNLYNRANACVACHQNVEADILAAGHPELIFELDGQSVSEPKHWQEQTNWSGAQTWLVGQAVALREISWQIEKSNPANVIDAQFKDARWMGLAYLFSDIGQTVPGIEPSIFLSHNRWGPPSARTHADEIAQKTAQLKWTPKVTHDCLVSMAERSRQFRDAKIPQMIQARHAERLVLTLERLLNAMRLKNKPADAALDHLFKLAQSLPDFDPNKFADALDDFAKTLK